MDLLIPGVAVDPADDVIERRRTAPYGIEPTQVVEVGAARGGAEAHVRVDEGDVLELVYADGLVDLVTAQDARRTAVRTRADGRLTLPTQLGPATRGGPSGVLARVRSYRLPSIEDLVTGGLLDAAARTSGRALARALVAHNERQFERANALPGLHRVDRSFQPVEHITDASAIDASEPYLVLIHGTFSSHHAYTGLTRGAEWDDLWRHYDGRVLIFDHRTLSVSPARNALDLLEVLPAGARLHLVTHSRGGLVGEHVSVGPPTAEQIDRFAAARPGDPDAEVELLGDLAEAIRQRQPRVERFVRVAGPMGGTLLAARRADRFLKVMLNVVNLVPGVAGNPAYGFVKSLALSMVGHRSDVGDVPGIEAMMPESPWIALLATTPRPVDDGLAVIAGDTAAAGVLGRLKTLATDLYYREDHDLVVNTRSMYLGATRTRMYASFQRGAHISHSAYFSEDVARARLRNWLVRPDHADDARVRGFRPVDAGGLLTEPDNVTRTESGVARAAVLLVGAPTTTRLRDADGLVWPDVARLARDGVAALHGDLTVDGVLDVGYGSLVEHLSTHADVIPVAWDWRQRPEVSGPAVAAAIEAALEAGHERVSVLAHGGGGLPALWVRAARPELWSRMREGGGQLVLVDTPMGPARDARRWIGGRGDLVAQLTLLDPRLGREQVASSLAGLEGLALLAGRGAQDLVRDGDWSGVSYVAGREPAQATPLPTGLATWTAAATGTELLASPDVAAGLAQLLSTGRTSSLAVGASATAAPRAPEPDEDAASTPLPFPTASSLVASGLADLDLRPQAAAPPRLRVEVLHGSLEHAGLPVMVGHHDGTSLGGAERFLDARLGGRLSERQIVGIYPRTPDDAIALLTPGVEPPGAVVVGLGRPGELTSQRLTEAVTAGALQLAATIADAPVTPGEVLPRPARFASVLIGSSGRGGLTVETSALAIVKGVAAATRVLTANRLDERVCIDGLQLIELYADRAEMAARAVSTVGERLGGELGGGLVLEGDRFLRDLTGGLPGQAPADYGAGTWQRISIKGRVGDDHTSLQFTTIGGRAGADTDHHELERAFVDGLLTEAVRSARPDAQVNNTLYELMLPPSRKAAMQEVDNVQLVVDDVSAAYPWEVLAGRGESETSQPLALRSGLLRQLELPPGRSIVRRSGGNRALVIGDPPAGSLPALPQARAEAEAVASRLEAEGFEVTRLIASDTATPSWTEIANALFASEHRILHVAGHGVYRPDDPTASGVVIGPDRYLTARTIAQMPTVPDLVFLNCCHVGAVAPRPAIDAPSVHTDTSSNLHRMAASVSAAMMQVGVGAVIAAGWAVDDTAAAAFAATLYDGLLEGTDLGTSVRTARLAAHRADGGRSNTWGAYQCYGDPSFALRLPRDASRSDEATVAWPALIRRLEQLTSRAGESPDSSAIAAELAELAASTPSVWRHAELDAAFGAAWAEVGELEEALQAYRRALGAWDADAPIRILEQLSSVESDLAVRLHREGGDAREVARLFDEAEHRLSRLVDIAPTPERHALMASLCKKRATTLAEPPEDRAAHVQRAREEYEAAAQLAARAGEDLPYQVLNALQMAWLAGEVPDNWPHQCDRAVRAAQRLRAARRGDRWIQLTDADAQLTAALLDGRLAHELADVAASYEEPLATLGPRVRASVVGHMQDLAELARDGERDALRSLARRLADA